MTTPKPPVQAAASGKKKSTRRRRGATAPSAPARIRAYERQQQALKLRLDGWSTQRIADALGYKDRGGAHKAILAALEELRAENLELAETYRDAELERLADLEAVWRPLARTGDDKAAAICLRITDLRAKLLGLNAPTQITGANGGPIEIEVGVVRERIVQKLQLMSNRQGELTA